MLWPIRTSTYSCGLGWTWKRSDGYRMVNKVASTFSVSRRVECLNKCVRSPVCDSYNYRPGDKTCQLNTHRRASSTLTDVPVQHSQTCQLNTHRRVSSTLTDVPAQHSQTCQLNTHRRASSTLTDVPAQHSQTCQFNTHRRASSTLTCCRSVTRTTTVLATRHASSTLADVPAQHSPVAGLRLVQLPSRRQDVPAQHSRHSAHRQLDRHRRRRRVGLVESNLRRCPVDKTLTRPRVLCQCTRTASISDTSWCVSLAASTLPD